MSIADLERLLSTWPLAAARTLPVVWSIPAFGGATLPAVIRLSMGLGLSLLCLPFAGMPTVDGVGWLALFARETLVGIALAFVCACAFRAAELAGYLIDASRGVGWSSSTSALSTEQSTPLASLILSLACLAFFQIGGPGHLAWALRHSYEAIPLAWDRSAPSAQAAAFTAIVASAKLFESAIAIAAPVLVAVLLTDLVLGIVSRAVPQLPVASAAAPLKSVVVVAVLLFGLGTMQAGLQGGLRSFLAILSANWIH